MGKKVLTPPRWPRSSPGAIDGLAEVPAGEIPRLLVRARRGRLWHRPASAGIDTDGDLHVVTGCGAYLSRAAGLKDEVFGSPLCHKCWKRYEAPPTNVCLGHLVEHKRVELPSGRFELSMLNVELGVRTRYAGRLILKLVPGFKIRGSAHPLADFAKASEPIEINGLYVEFADAGLDRRGERAPEVITAVATAAASRPAIRYMTRLVTTGTPSAALTADEVARLLGRQLPRHERKAKVRERLLVLLAKHDGKPGWWKQIASDTKLLELAGRDSYTREHIYAMKRDAIQDGDYVPSTT